jgi:phage terminase large subunit GpA-like protein
LTAPWLDRARDVERRVIRSRFRSPPKLTLSQWADRFMVLSSESSFRTGPFSTDDAPYQREPMDAMSDPSIRRVVCRWSSQLGKTIMLNAFIAYRIDQDPGPILMLQPTLDMAESWSKERLAPMLRDVPRLRGKVASARSRDSGNTLLNKTFPGGHLAIAGANSPAGLASRPIRDLLQDEVDRYPLTTGTEGNPSSIAESRTATFPNAKVIIISSPTFKGSAIDAEWEASDQRWLWVPCPHCGHEQKLEFGGKDTKYGLKWESGKPETAHYVCAACACVIEETDKPLMLKRQRWVAENPESKIVGFTANALYSPFFTWARLVERWLREKKDPLKLKAFVNTMLCENWEETGESVTAHILESRMDPLPERIDGLDDDGNPKIIKLVPMNAAVLTRAVDVQGDRLETSVWAWGEGEEAWRVDFDLLPGDPATNVPWLQLDKLLAKKYEHESGALLQCAVTFIDSGGHHSKQAYEFARGRVKQRVFAIKGSSLQQGVALLSKPTRNVAARIVTYSVGSFTGKEVLMSRLTKIEDPGPGYIHLPSDIDPAHLDQFLNEKLMTRFVKGRPVRGWVRTGPNEQIDLYVYALAALHALGPLTFRNLGNIAKKLALKAKAVIEPTTPEKLPDDELPMTEEEKEPPPPKRKKERRRSRWIYGD